MDKIIKLGDSGNDVTYLQVRLKLLCAEDIQIDGKFGESTYRILKSFQEKNGLEPDGVYGPHTDAKLRVCMNETAVKDYLERHLSTSQLGNSISLGTSFEGRRHFNAVSEDDVRNFLKIYENGLEDISMNSITNELINTIKECSFSTILGGMFEGHRVAKKLEMSVCEYFQSRFKKLGMEATIRQQGFLENIRSSCKNYRPCMNYAQDTLKKSFCDFPALKSRIDLIASETTQQKNCKIGGIGIGIVIALVKPLWLLVKAEDNQQWRNKFKKAVSESIDSFIIGGIAGIMAAAIVGAVVGTVVGPEGTVAGGALGTVVGALFAVIVFIVEMLLAFLLAVILSLIIRWFSDIVLHNSSPTMGLYDHFPLLNTHLNFSNLNINYR